MCLQVECGAALVFVDVLASLTRLVCVVGLLGKVMALDVLGVCRVCLPASPSALERGGGHDFLFR